MMISAPKKHALPSLILIFHIHLCLGSSMAGAHEHPGAEVDFNPCGTWQRLERMEESTSASRPPDGTYIRDSAHFRIHYEDPLLDEYADTLLAGAEHAYRVYIDTLLYPVPPSDGVGGGDSRTDIYVISATNITYWAQSFWETQMPRPPYDNAWSGYFEIIDTLPAAWAKTITAHEYFHLVQFGYDLNESISLMEMTAVWSEERTYDEVNLYTAYDLAGFFSQPQRNLLSFLYDNAPWAFYLSENFGDDIIQTIHEEGGVVPGDNAVEAMNIALTGVGTTLADEFATFTQWNFFTGPRDRGDCYEEGSGFPLAFIEKDIECLPLFDYLPPRRIAALGCNYFTVLGDRTTDTLMVKLTLNIAADWIVTLARFKGSDVFHERHHYPPQATWDPHVFKISDWEECDSLLVIPAVVTTSGSNYETVVSAYHKRTAPPELPYVLVLDRSNCIRPFDGTGDDYDPATGEAYPFAEGLAEHDVRCILTDSIPHALSLCGAVFLVGGFDEGGSILEPHEFDSLMSYMDRGGDVYIESTRWGEWLDPDHGNPTPQELAFWNYFGCSFVPGNPMAQGNVSSWQTYGNSPLGLFMFDYHTMSLADDYVGDLVPDGGADTLIIDGSGRVRGTLNHGPNKSDRILVTVMLGASTEAGSPAQKHVASARGAFLRDILDQFDTIVASLALRYIDATVTGSTVSISGEITGVGAEVFSMWRLDSDRPGESGVALPLIMNRYGSRVQINLLDTPPPGRYCYRLTAVNERGERVLWEREIRMGDAVPGIDLLSVYPNPSRDVFRIEISSERMERPVVSIFDPTGRLVYHRQEHVNEGISTVIWMGVDNRGRRLPSGVYFLHISSRGYSETKKLVLLK